MIDVDNIYVDGASIDGYGQGYSADIGDGNTYEITDDGNGGLHAGLGGGIFGWGNKWEKDPAAATIDEKVQLPVGVDMSNTQQMSWGEAAAARAAIKLGIGPYRDCSKGGCKLK